MALYSSLRNRLGPGIRFLWMSDTAVPNVLLSLLVDELDEPSGSFRQIRVRMSWSAMQI